MKNTLPEYLKQGEPARLFPVLSTVSREGRTSSILLACLTKIQPLASELLSSVDQKVGVTAKLATYTEIVFRNQSSDPDDRPDGLIVLRIGKREWKALVEAKVGSNKLDAKQIEKYRKLAKENKVDCVITISNQFATSPNNHPLEEVRKVRSKIPVFHWSWMHILTIADLLVSRNGVEDNDQLLLLNELRRFLGHESAGVKGFERMPSEWTELNKLVSTGGSIPASSRDATAVLQAWHQETRDLSLILSRQTESIVTERLSRSHFIDPAKRFQAELKLLREDAQLASSLEIQGAAAPLEVVLDLSRRCIDVGMTLKAPTDKKSTKARLNWLLRQIEDEDTEHLFLRLLWPGTSQATQFSLDEFRNDPDIANDGKGHLSPHGFYLFESRRTGPRFTQQVNIIKDLEVAVPSFYKRIGSSLRAWQPSAARIREDRASASEVSPGAISEGADYLG